VKLISPSAEEKSSQYFKPEKQAESKAQDENDDVPQYPLPTAPHAVDNSISCPAQWSLLSGCE